MDATPERHAAVSEPDWLTWFTCCHGATVCDCSSVETNSVIYFAYGSVFGAFPSRRVYFNTLEIFQKLQ